MSDRPSFGLGAYVRLARPFTLLAPAAGMICWGLVAVGAAPATKLTGFLWGQMGLGALMAAFMNCASNAVNQIYDREIDAINKPKRPIPAGDIGVRGAWIFTVLFYLLGVGTAALINLSTLVIVVFTVFVTYAYSGPPFRTKRWGLLANFTIAIPRGLLLPVAGWCAVVGSGEFGGKGVDSFEIWYLGAMSGLFILGAATTKDYADMEGDRAQGCITLPLRYGVRRSAILISPFLTLPFLALPLGVAGGILTGPGLALSVLGGALCLWGGWVVWLLLRDPGALTRSSTHPSWAHMYLMMVATQVGLALTYVVAG